MNSSDIYYRVEKPQVKVRTIPKTAFVKNNAKNRKIVSLFSGVTKEENYDPRLKQTMFFVEATRFEQVTLWEKWHDSVWGVEASILGWDEDCKGAIHQTGIIDQRPIWTAFFWAKIDGRLVCFYETTSPVADANQTEAWIKSIHFPKWDSGSRSAFCDAMNFHHCIDAIRDMNKETVVL